MEKAKQSVGLPPGGRDSSGDEGAGGEGRGMRGVEDVQGRNISCLARRARTLKAGSSFIEAPLGFVPWWILHILQ